MRCTTYACKKVGIMNILDKKEETANAQRDGFITKAECTADHKPNSTLSSEKVVSDAPMVGDYIADPLNESNNKRIDDKIMSADTNHLVRVDAFNDTNDGLETNIHENLSCSDDPAEPKDTRRTSILTFLRDIAISFGIALLIVQFINPTVVKGQSMEPTLHDSNYIFLSKKQYTFSEIHHGQIVVFKPNETLDPSNKDNLLIKRVIALSGDELVIKGGNVFINGEIIYESYLMEQYTAGNLESLIIPDGYVFVMGDNRQHSLDSRSSNVGLVSEKQIIGMAFFRVFPLDQFGLLT